MAESNVKTNKRFASSTDEDIDQLIKSKVARKTILSTETAMRLFYSYCHEKNIDFQPEKELHCKQ